jgi:hypothetical protein
MMNDRMLFVHFLSDDGRGPGWSFQLRPIYDLIRRCQPRVRPRVGWQIADRHFSDFRVSGGCNVLDRDSAIHNRVVANGVVVDDGGSVINVANLSGLQTSMAQVPVGKMIQRNERKMVSAQPKVELRADAKPIEAPARAHVKGGMRRQRGPPAMITARAPNDPGGPPNGIRRPHPTAALV